MQPIALKFDKVTPKDLAPILPGIQAGLRRKSLIAIAIPVVEEGLEDAIVAGGITFTVALADDGPKWAGATPPE